LLENLDSKTDDSIEIFNVSVFQELLKLIFIFFDFSGFNSSKKTTSLAPVKAA